MTRTKQEPTLEETLKAQVPVVGADTREQIITRALASTDQDLDAMLLALNQTPGIGALTREQLEAAIAAYGAEQRASTERSNRRVGALYKIAAGIGVIAMVGGALYVASEKAQAKRAEALAPVAQTNLSEMDRQKYMIEFESQGYVVRDDMFPEVIFSRTVNGTTIELISGKFRNNIYEIRKSAGGKLVERHLFDVIETDDGKVFGKPLRSLIFHEKGATLADYRKGVIQIHGTPEKADVSAGDYRTKADMMFKGIDMLRK